MNIYDYTKQMPVMAEIFRRRLFIEEENERKKAELQEMLSNDNIISLIMDIEEMGGIVDLETGDVFWPK